MLLLTNAGSAPDKIQLVTSAAVTVDVHASYVDASNANPPVVQGDTMGRQNTPISTATTTDIVAAPAANEIRNVKTLHIRNKHATSAVDVTLVYDQNGTDFELHKATLRAGDMLEYIEGIGFFVITSTAKLDAKLRVASDVVNPTTSFADVTGLTCPVLTGKHYNFEAHLLYVCNATTTGARFGVNGPTMTAMRVSALQTVTGSATAAALSAPVADITAVDTIVSAQTTGPANVVLGILSGWINPSADGTFAVRCASEIAVAAGLTVKTGSWLHIWEPDA